MGGGGAAQSSHVKDPANRDYRLTELLAIVLIRRAGRDRGHISHQLTPKSL